MEMVRDRALFLVLCAAVLVLAVGCSAGISECYQWSRFPAERLVLDVKHHSELSQDQQAYSVHGKHVGVCGAGSIASVTGTIVTATSPLPVTGAHMGLRTHSVRATASPVDAHFNFCKEVTLDCTSGTPGVTPQTWTCVGRNEWDRIPGIGKSMVSVLTQVSPPDALCHVFQNGGTGAPFAPTSVPPGPFSGGGEP